jgi:mono/diheme cytochrome c family protein
VEPERLLLERLALGDVAGRLRRCIACLVLALAALGCAREHKPAAQTVGSDLASVHADSRVKDFPAAEASAPEVETLHAACRGCHTEEVLTQQRLTDAQWTKVLEKMHRWGAPIEDADVPTLTALLAQRYRRDAGPFVPERLSADAAAKLFEPKDDGAFAGGDRERGHALYADRCEPCHATDGRGGPLGLNLVRARVLDRPADVATIVRGGSGRMPGFETTDAELADLLAYLRTL